MYIEEPEERYGFISIKTLKPQPIPLTTKVILIGDPNIYQMMFSLDPDFRELFKIKAEFDTTMPRTDKECQQYAAFVCGLCEKENLKHLDGGALAKLIEYSSRIIEDQYKLSTQFSLVADVVREANFYAVRGQLRIHNSRPCEEEPLKKKFIAPNSFKKKFRK